MLGHYSRTLDPDRRLDVRLEGGACILAAVIDSDPWQPIEDPSIENISVAGMALLTPTHVEPGARVVVWTADGSPRDVSASVVLEVLDTANWQEGRRVLHCRVLEGMVPATMIFSWESALGIAG
jgi:hypothetical protein